MEDDRCRSNRGGRDPSLPPEIEDEITRRVKRLCGSIRSRKKRIAVEDELTDHFRLAVADMALCGVPPERALSEVAASFGDPAILRQQLASVHNRLPPAFWPFMGGLLLRMLLAAAVTLPLWGIVTANGLRFSWYHLLPGVLILVGLHPITWLWSAFRRGDVRRRIRRFCRETGSTPLSIPSPAAAVLGSASLYLLAVSGRVVAVKYLYVPRRAEVRFADETTVLAIRRRRGIGLADRRPGQFNLIKPATVGDVTIRPLAYSYLLPPEWAAAAGVGGIERLLVLEPYPMEVTHIAGNTVEEVTPGERVFGFRIHTRKTALARLASLAQTKKEDTTP